MPSALERLQDELFLKSRSMPPPWGPVVRLLRYPAAVVRDWLEGGIDVRAMSLAYTTLLSLVPLMVFSFAILKGIGARTDLHFILREFFRPLGVASNQLTDSLLEFVSNMRGDVLGSLGLIFLTYTVISTIQKVETSFNFVWRVDRPRNLARRFTEYLSLMIAAPIMLVVVLGLLGSALQSPTARWLNSIAPLSWALSALSGVLPYVIVSVVFALMYLFIPNTRVEVRAALIGGVTAGIVWALVGRTFTSVLIYSSQLMAIYSGFAIVLATLIWVYVSWLVLLIGAELAFYVQFPQYLPHGRDSVTLDGRARESLGLSVMYLIGRDYRGGVTSRTAGSLACALDVPPTVLAPVLASLEAAGLIVATEKESFLPGRDPGYIKISAVIDALRAPHESTLIGKPAAPAAELMVRIDEAMRRDLDDRSLEDLIGGS